MANVILEFMDSIISPEIETRSIGYAMHQGSDIFNAASGRSPSVVTSGELQRNSQSIENATSKGVTTQDRRASSEAYEPSSEDGLEVITDTRQEASSDTFDWSNEFSLDTREGYSNQLIGLSCESDPYLLRNYSYNKYDTYPMFRLDFRKMKDDASVQPFLPISSNGSSCLPVDCPPVPFVMTHENIWSDSQKFVQAIQSGGNTEESDLELLMKIVPADLGPRLLKL